MTFEQWLELAKVVSPALVGIFVGLAPSFWIVRELNRIWKEIELLRTELKFKGK